MAELHVFESEPVGTKVVDLLEQMLAKAENGELSSLAIAAVKRDGCAEWHWSFAPNTSTLIGSIERMKYDIINATDA